MTQGYRVLTRLSCPRAVFAASVIAASWASRRRRSGSIPKRAVDSGLIDQFGNVDPTDGGDSQLFSVSGTW